MRSLSLSIMLLTMLFCFSACVSPTVSSESEQPDFPLAGESEVPELSEPEAKNNQLPYEQQIASITPKLRDQILEKEKENSDAVGWLIVPGTTINDVILQNPPGNNNYYTTHDFLQKPSKDGAYGADYRCKLFDTRDGLSRNTSLYAHNHDDNPDGILFSQLKKYKDPDFAKANPYIFFSILDEDMVWEVFAVYDATVDFPYILSNSPWRLFSKLVDTVYDASIYDYGITLSENDKLLTLSTCTFSVAGHNPMPVDIPNDYRFVVMARLVDPSEQIKKEAMFTVNDSPLAPDDIPSFAYLTTDIFMLDGLECGIAEYFYDDDCVEPIDFDKLVPIGKIKQSNVNDNLENWDATQLPVGTTIYQDPDYVDMLVADIDGSMIPYIAKRQERELHSVRYIHQNRNGVITDKSLEVGQFDKNEHMERLSPFIDMIHFMPITDDMDTIELRDDKDEIRICAKNSLATFYHIFFLGVPASVGKEVLIIKQSDGYYYGDAALYPRLEETLNYLFA